jgi:hypothetical protein
MDVLMKGLKGGYTRTLEIPNRRKCCVHIVLLSWWNIFSIESCKSSFYSYNINSNSVGFKSVIHRF